MHRTDVPETMASHTPFTQEAAPAVAPLPTRIDTLTTEVAALRSHVEELRILGSFPAFADD